MGKRLVKSLKYLFECFLSIVYPNKGVCLICDEEYEEDYICEKCKDLLIRVEKTMIDEYKGEKFTIHSCMHYTKELKKLIVDFKVHKNFLAGEVLKDIIIDGVKFWNITGDLITYVPLSRSKEKKRGFNQCYYLAKKVAEFYYIPMKTLLYKENNIKEQKKLSKSERKSNVENAFKIIERDTINDKVIILIDDVVTTGATVLACAYELKKMGAKEVNILTVGQSRI